MIELGDRGRDVVTEFEGTVTARTEFYGSSPSVRLTRTAKDGSPEDEWFPAQRVELVDNAPKLGFPRG